MQVIAEHRVRQTIDPEGTREKLQSITNPTPSMLEGLPRESIFATEKRPPDTSLNGMKDLDFRRRVQSGW